MTTASTIQDHDTEMQSKENSEQRDNNENGEITGSSSRALTEQEQEEITVLLRAWVSVLCYFGLFVIFAYL